LSSDLNRVGEANMRAVAIAPDSYKTFPDLLEGMHRLRARVFRDRLNWDVDVRDEREADSFDDCRPTYILAITDRNAVVGCARLLPATGPTLLSVLFPELRERGLIKPHVAMVESSRFCVDTSLEAGRAGQVSARCRRWTMFAAIIEWSMANRAIPSSITATDVRIERILKPCRLAHEPYRRTARSSATRWRWSACSRRISRASNGCGRRLRVHHRSAPAAFPSPPDPQTAGSARRPALRRPRRPSVVEIMLNPDGRLFIERLGHGIAPPAR
jgi:N-acyl-L-homoserine lactone synthetase